MRFHVVIPARFASTRLPGKPLLDIAGRSMIQHVLEQACASSADEVLVATDDARIAAAVSDPRGRGIPAAMLTDPALPSGTDRVAAVAAARGWSDDAIVVNVQGDEPFLPPMLVDQVAAALAAESSAGLATLAEPIRTLAEFMDPNVVKVVVASDGSALYFSRAPIPWSRDGAPEGLSSQSVFRDGLRHVGIYAYRVGVLKRLTSLPPSRLEQIERLEQLRALEHGIRIAVAACGTDPGFGVDTAADLERARRHAARVG